MTISPAATPIASAITCAASLGERNDPYFEGGIPGLPGPMGILEVAEGRVVVDAFSISVRARTTSSSAGRIASSALGPCCPGPCHGSKPMLQRLCHAPGPHKLRECATGKLRAVPQCRAPPMMRMHLGNCRHFGRRRSPGLLTLSRCRVVLFRRLALHPRRLQIPSAEDAAGRLRVYHSPVRDTTIIRTEFHAHTFDHGRLGTRPRYDRRICSRCDTAPDSHRNTITCNRKRSFFAAID
jgi:hypothetical protein